MSDTIKFLKTRKVKSPNRANQYDAGIDFYVPEFTPEFVELLKQKNPHISISDYSAILESGQRILIPSGIYCQMENNDRCLIAANKSGVATKLGLVFGAQVIDFEYQGEIHLSLIYTGSGSVEILPGMKILQFIETPIYTSYIEVTTDIIPTEFYRNVTSRKDGGFGSSDNK